jgi:transcriptional regulator
MYVPKHFAVTDRAQLFSFIRAHAFGILVSAVDGGPVATHVPFVLLEQGERVRLGLHVAKANPHWQSIDGAQVLAIFHGSHGLVSGSSYAQPEQTVPTWNYSAVHCTGRATIASPEQTHRILETLVHEQEGPGGWSMREANGEYVERMRRAIVGIEIAVTSIEGAFKYSQNRNEDDRRRVLERLDGSSPDLARDMRDYYDDPVKVW